MQITQRKSDGKWVLLGDNKEVVQEFNSRDEAVGELKARSKPKEKKEGCSHGNKDAEESHFIPNPDFSEGHFEIVRSRMKKGYSRDVAAQEYMGPETEAYKWSEPFILGSFIGRLCRDCGLVVLPDGTTREVPTSPDLDFLDNLAKSMIAHIPTTNEHNAKRNSRS